MSYSPTCAPRAYLWCFFRLRASEAWAFGSVQFSRVLSCVLRSVIFDNAPPQQESSAACEIEAPSPTYLTARGGKSTPQASTHHQTPTAALYHNLLQPSCGVVGVLSRTVPASHWCGLPEPHAQQRCIRGLLSRRPTGLDGTG